MSAEENYKLGLKPYCRTCEYCRRNPSSWSTVDIKYKNPVTERMNNLRMKRSSYYCFHISMCNEKGKPHKINGNHVKWWGFAPSCPFNQYTHTCDACGQRMATKKEVCSSCKKNMELNKRGML